MSIFYNEYNGIFPHGFCSNFPFFPFPTFNLPHTLNSHFPSQQLIPITPHNYSISQFMQTKRKIGIGPCKLSSLDQPGHCGVAAGLLKVDTGLGSRHTRAHLWFLEVKSGKPTICPRCSYPVYTVCYFIKMDNYFLDIQYYRICT